MYLAYKKDNLNKILLLLLIGFFMLLIFASPSFAGTFTLEGETYTTNEIFDNNFLTKKYIFIVHAFRHKQYEIYASDVPFFDSDVSSGITLSLPDNTTYVRYGWVSTLENLFNPSVVSSYTTGSLSDTLDSYYYKIFYTNFDFKDTNDNVVFKGSLSENKPKIITKQEDLETGKFANLEIDAGDLDYLDSKPFGLVVYDFTSSLLGNKTDISSLTPVAHFQLDSDSPYRIFEDFEASYVIPREKLGINLDNGKKYTFALVDLEDYTIFNRVTFTIGGLTAEEELKNKQDEMNKKLEDQTNAIKESNETNKNIFERIGDLLSYINPFSENFFVYKLIELLVDAIKSLFIPSDDFFSTYFTNLKDWFSDRLGFLFYPFELIIDILTKVLNINFSEPIFNIPDMYEPFTNSKLIAATTFNLNSMLENGIFKTIHDIYLVCVDAFVTFELVNLFKRKYEEVTTK